MHCRYGRGGNGIMNTYLFSIHPKWCEKIFNGEKQHFAISTKGEVIGTIFDKEEL